MTPASAWTADLNLALDEALLRGARWDVESAQVDVSVRVLTLTECGLPDPDPDRVLRLSGVSLLRIMLRRDRIGTLGFGPPIRLADASAVDDFLASLAFSGPMHGGKAIDDPSPSDDWPATVSLTARMRAGRAAHHLYWFTECGRHEAGGTVGYCLEGLVEFTDVSVHRITGEPLTFEDLAAGARRWWDADDFRSRVR